MSKNKTTCNHKAVLDDGLSPNVLNEFRTLQQLDPKNNKEIIEAANRVSMAAREDEDMRLTGCDFRAFSLVAHDLVGRTLTRVLDTGRPAREAHSYITGVSVERDQIRLDALTIDAFNMLGAIRGIVNYQLGIHREFLTLRGTDMYVRGKRVYIDSPEAFAEFNVKFRAIAEAVDEKLVPALRIKPKKTKFKYGRPPKTSTRQRKTNDFHK